MRVLNLVLNMLCSINGKINFDYNKISIYFAIKLNIKIMTQEELKEKRDEFQKLAQTHLDLGMRKVNIKKLLGKKFGYSDSSMNLILNKMKPSNEFKKGGVK